MDKFIHVILWGQDIGSLMWKKSTGEAYFVYNPDFLGSPIEPFPLTAPKVHDRFWHFPSTEGKKFQHLPSFIADSLPDDWGNELFDQWVTNQKNISRRDITPLDKLSFIGQRGMGALEFVPNMEIKVPDKCIDVASLAKLANKIFEQREQIIILPDESITMQMLLAVGTSAGGRQPKAILAINPETKEIHSGQITGLDGYKYYILKFGDSVRSTAELEMTYYELATKAGIRMMPSRLWKVDGVNHFLTERFDRQEGQKLHTQTLAAMRPEADSYEDLLLTCREMRLSDSASAEIFRRMVFNYMANNTDDHDKNFAFMMNPNGVWSLAPAYDMTFIFHSNGLQPEYEHCLRMRGLRSDWSKLDVMAFAKDNGIIGAERIIKEVATALMSFRELAIKNEVNEQWIGCVESAIRQHLTDWGYLPSVETSWMTADGRQVEDVRLEMTNRSVLKLCAIIDGKKRHTFITKTKPEYQIAMHLGFANVPKATLCVWAETYLVE